MSIEASDVPSFLRHHIASFRSEVNTLEARGEIYPDNAGIYLLMDALYRHVADLSRRSDARADLMAAITAIGAMLTEGSRGVKDCVKIEILDQMLSDDAFLERVQADLPTTFVEALDEKRRAWGEWHRERHG
ncbi:MAG: hypothetical protein WCC84_04795 [Candidatus Cybelea sp.]